MEKKEMKIIENTEEDRLVNIEQAIENLEIAVTQIGEDLHILRTQFHNHGHSDDIVFVRL